MCFVMETAEVSDSMIVDRSPKGIPGDSVSCGGSGVRLDEEGSLGNSINTMRSGGKRTCMPPTGLVLQF